MRPNLFKGFGLFLENVPDKPGEGPGYMHTLKKQLPVDYTAFMFQPISVDAGKPFGKYKLERPLVLKIDKWDDNTVTLVTVPQDGITFNKQPFDRDREMNLRPGIPTEREEFILTHEEMEKLLEPPPQPPQPGGMM